MRNYSTTAKNGSAVDDVRSALGEVGHTAVGLAALAAKRANEVRLEFAERYEPQFVEARTRALQLVDSVEHARTRVDESVDPFLDRATERLPEPVQEIVGEYRRAVRRAQDVAHDLTVKAIEAATAVPKKRPARVTRVAVRTHEPLVKQPAATAPARKARATRATGGPKAVSTRRVATGAKPGPKATVRAAGARKARVAKTA